MVKNEESKSSQQLNIEHVERQRRLWANRRKRWAAWKRDNQKGSSALPVESSKTIWNRSGDCCFTGTMAECEAWLASFKSILGESASMKLFIEDSSKGFTSFGSK